MNKIIIRRGYLYLILLMYMEVGPVRVLRPVFEDVNNLYSFRSVE